MTRQLVIVGGGPAATHAAETIRKLDGDAQLTMICDEPPHSRMALPYWLAGKIPQEQMYTGSAETFRQHDITWMEGVPAVGLDERNRQLTLSDQRVIAFDESVARHRIAPAELTDSGSRSARRAESVDSGRRTAIADDGRSLSPTASRAGRCGVHWSDRAQRPASARLAACHRGTRISSAAPDAANRCGDPGAGMVASARGRLAWFLGSARDHPGRGR